VHTGVPGRTRNPKSLKVSAYLYADDPAKNQRPDELFLLELIDRFGVAATMGRSILYAGEMLRMRTAESIVSSYQNRAQAEDGWAGWASRNPVANRLLVEAEKLANE